MSGTIIFDLDDTLLDTHRLKADLITALGLPEEVKWTPLVEQAGRLDAQAAWAAQVGTCTAEEATRIFRAVLPDLSTYLLPGAHDLLNTLHREQQTLALLTKGAPAWQQQKAHAAGILPFFTHTHYTQFEKETLMSLFHTWPAPHIFINDNGLEIDAMAAAFPDATYFALQRHKPLPTRGGIPIYRTLQEIAQAFQANHIA